MESNINLFLNYLWTFLSTLKVFAFWIIYYYFLTFTKADYPLKFN